jgi:hypothetical protein
MTTVSNKKPFELDPTLKPLQPTLTLAEPIPGTDQRVVTKYYGNVDSAAAKRDIKYRAEQLAPAPVRQRRERAFDSHVRGFDANGEPLLVKRTTRARKLRHDDAYAA